MRASACLGVLAVAAALVGCTVGPRYMPPSTPDTGKGAFKAGAPDVSAETPPPANWWRLYQDAALDALVQDALAHNKNLLVAAANLAEARGALEQARAGRYPTTDLTAGAQYGVSTDQLLIAGLTGSGAPPPAPFYTAGLDVSYELDLFGRIHRAVQAAAANVQAYQAAEDYARVTVAGETTRAYLNACAYAQEYAIAEQSLNLVTQTYDITVKEASAGAASDFDIARARALVEQTRADLPTYEGERRTALFELAVLTGRPPEEVSKAADDCRAPPRLAQMIPTGDGAALLRRRPDVREAERQLASNVARIGVATADLYPTISLGATAATAGSTLGQLVSTSSLSYGIGPLLSWSFPNTLVAQAEVRQAKAVASASLANFQQTVLQALQDVETALAAYAGELRRNRALVASRDQNQIAFRLAQVRFNAGEASYLDLLTAETDLVNANSALAASDQAIASDQATVFKALGGGWEQAPPLTALPISDARHPDKPIPVE